MANLKSLVSSLKSVVPRNWQRLAVWALLAVAAWCVYTRYARRSCGFDNDYEEDDGPDDDMPSVDGDDDDTPATGAAPMGAMGDMPMGEGDTLSAFSGATDQELVDRQIKINRYLTSRRKQCNSQAKPSEPCDGSYKCRGSKGGQGRWVCETKSQAGKRMCEKKAGHTWTGSACIIDHSRF